MKSIPALLVLAFALSAMGQGSNPVQPFPQAKYSLTATNGSDTGTVSVTNILPSLTFTIIYDGATNSQVVAATNVALSLVNTGLTAQTKNVSVRVADSSGNASTTIKPVTVVPVTVANFTGTPVSGQPPLAVLFTNLSTGTITNALWNFGVLTNGGSAFTTQTLARSVSVTFGGSTNDYRTNSVSLTVAGYGTSTLTRTNYVSAFQGYYALNFPGGGPKAVSVDSNLLWITPPFTFSAWASKSVSDNKGWAGAGPVTVGALDNWRVEGNVYLAQGGEVAGSFTFPTDGTWHKLTVDVAADGVTVSNYMDGVFQATTTLPSAITPSVPMNFILGNAAQGPDGGSDLASFVGLLTDVSFGTNGISGPLVAHWSMQSEGGAGTNIVDIIGGKNLIIIGGAEWTNIVTHP